MNSKEILEKAIQKAIDGGLNPEPVFLHTGFEPEAIEYHEPSRYIGYFRRGMYLEQLIFNHDFAKAIWPEGHCCKQEDLNFDDHMRQLEHHLYHEAEMVIAEDPIKYLGDNI